MKYFGNSSFLLVFLNKLLMSVLVGFRRCFRDVNVFINANYKVSTCCYFVTDSHFYDEIVNKISPAKTLYDDTIEMLLRLSNGKFVS